MCSCPSTPYQSSRQHPTVQAATRQISLLEGRRLRRWDDAADKWLPLGRSHAPMGLDARLPTWSGAHGPSVPTGKEHCLGARIRHWRCRFAETWMLKPNSVNMRNRVSHNTGGRDRIAGCWRSGPGSWQWGTLCRGVGPVKPRYGAEGQRVARESARGVKPRSGCRREPRRAQQRRLKPVKAASEKAKRNQPRHCPGWGAMLAGGADRYGSDRARVHSEIDSANAGRSARRADPSRGSRRAPPDVGDCQFEGRLATGHCATAGAGRGRCNPARGGSSGRSRP